MASVTRSNDGKSMADDREARDAAENGGNGGSPPRGPTATKDRPSGGGGFFSIYKPGQGYWTRILTALGAALVVILTAWFLYRHLPIWIGPLFSPGETALKAMEEAAAAVARENAQETAVRVSIGIVAAFVLVAAFIVYRILNKPDNADFLIATDSEMKKVNWTSRADLIGSTKVVIFFMFMIAAFLFVMDIAFGYLFWLIKVLQFSPFEL